MQFQMSGYYKIALTMLAMVGFLSATAGAQNAIAAICGVYSTIQGAIFIIGIMLMILGGALYAGGHLLPSQQKGTAQGYGMGMIIGGVIGVIIAVLAPYILTVIANSGNSTYSTAQCS